MIQDLRYGARMLLKHPGFTLIAVLTLALGIGANTAIFSIVNAVLLRPFPYQAPERLVILRGALSVRGLRRRPIPTLLIGARRTRSFDSIAAVRGNESFNFTGAGEPERLQGRLVSAEFFSTLGIKPLVGRDFLAEEDRPGATPAVILSYGFWQRRFGADQSIIGQTAHAQQSKLHRRRHYSGEFPVRGGSRRHCAHRSLRRNASDGAAQIREFAVVARLKAERVAAASGDGVESDRRASGTTVSGKQQRAARAD